MLETAATNETAVYYRRAHLARAQAFRVPAVWFAAWLGRKKEKPRPKTRLQPC